jgi:hypothetical protein
VSDETIYIGDPDDPDFEWRSDRTKRPLPRAVTRPLPGAAKLWKALRPRLQAGDLAAVEMAPSTFVALASRRELETLLDDAFEGAEGPDTLAARAVIRRLDRRVMYYLVAAPKPTDEG